MTRRQRILARRTVHPIRGACARPGSHGAFTRAVTSQLADDPGLLTVVPTDKPISVACVCGVALTCKVMGPPEIHPKPIGDGVYIAEWPIEVVSHA